MESKFKAEVTHDLPTHKEFNNTYRFGSRMLPFWCLLCAIVFIRYISMFSDPGTIYQYFFLAVVFVVIYLITFYAGGSIQFKRVLQNNNGQIRHIVYDFCDDAIHCTTPENGNVQPYDYDHFRYVIEGPRLILLVMKHRMCLLVEKSSIQGGTTEEFFSWIFQKCPNIKRKKVRKTGFGKWCFRLLAVVLIVGAVLAVLNLPGIHLFDRLSGRLHNNMSYQQMADALAELDIIISEQTIEELEEYDTEHYETYGNAYYQGSPAGQKVADLLYWEGVGVYDENTWEWTPSTSGIYWLEMEAFNADSIYTDFLTGLSAMNEDLDFENIQEDLSSADPEFGSGLVTVSFDWNGQHHELEAVYYTDWFDMAILYSMCEITASDDDPRNLYFCPDDYSGILLCYGDADWVRSLEKLTGMDFDNFERLLS